MPSTRARLEVIDGVPTATLTFASNPVTVAFTIDKLLDIETKQDRSLIEIFNELRQLIPMPRTLDGRRLSDEELSDLTAEERGRLQMSDQDNAEFGRRARIGKAADLVTMCTGIPRDQVIKDLGLAGVVNAAATLAMGFTGSVSSFLGADQEEDETGEPQAQASSDEPSPGPVSNSASDGMSSSGSAPRTLASSVAPSESETGDSTTEPESLRF